MATQGTAVIDFGAFGSKKTDTSVVITGQASIVAGSLVEAWIRPEATADHSADEHMVERIRVVAGNIVAGVGFTIYAFHDSEIIQRNPVQQSPSSIDAAGVGVAANYLGRVGGGSGVAERFYGAPVADDHNKATFPYGQFTVAWVWN